jgi:hypothetical protein
LAFLSNKNQRSLIYNIVTITNEKNVWLAPEGEAKFDSGLYREHLRDSWSQRRLTGNSGSSMIRVMVIATVIAGLIYWIFN